MDKQELLSLANIGKTEINGFLLEVKVFPSSVDGTPWIEIHVDPLSPLHPPLLLGQKWVEYVTDDECAELPEWLEKYKRQADEFFEQAKTIVKATWNNDGSYRFTDVPDSVKNNFKDYPSALKKWLKDRHYIRPVGKANEHWYAPGHFTLEIDGVQYRPLWSYWLDCACYKVDENIKAALDKTS